MATHFIDGMMPLYRYLPGGLVKHRNRITVKRNPDRMPPDVTENENDTYSIHHLTRSEAKRLLALAYSDVRLYGLCTALMDMLAPDTPGARIRAFLDGREGEQA